MNFHILSVSLPLSLFISLTLFVLLTNCRFVQSLALVEEMRHILRIVTQQSVLYEILNAYKKIKNNEYGELVMTLSS